MKFPRTLWYLTFLLLLPFFGSGKQLSATFDYCNFKANDSSGIFEYYISFEGPSMNYVYSIDGFYQSNIRVEVKVLDGEDIILFDKFDVTSPPIYDSSEFSKGFLVQNRIMLPNGNYKFSLERTSVFNSYG